MTSLIKAIDIFSTRVSFTIQQNQSYRTVLGGILTIIASGVFIVMFILLGSDFINQTNPKATLSEYANPNPQLISLKDYNYTIAFGIIKLGLEDINLHGGFLWATATSYNRIFNNELNKTVTENFVIPISKCNELSYIPYENFSSNLYCLDMSNNSLIGGKEHVLDSFINININYCEKNSPYWPSFFKCTSIDNLESTFKRLPSTSPYKMLIYYPVLYYDSRDKAQPAKIYSEALTFAFDHNLQREDTFYFHNSQSNSDLGWWFEDIKKENFWTVESRTFTNFYRSYESMNKDFTSSNVYLLNLQMSPKAKLYSRSYMKIQDAITVALTIVRILMIVFEGIIIFLNNTMINHHVFNELFNCSNPSIRSTFGVIHLKAPAQTQAINASGELVNEKSNLNVSKFNLSLPNSSQNPLPMAHNKPQPTVNMMMHNKKTSKQLPLKKQDCDSKHNPFTKCFAFKHSIGKAYLLTNRQKTVLKQYNQGMLVVNEKMQLETYIRHVYDVMVLKKTVPNIQYDVNFKVNLFNNGEYEQFFGPKSKEVIKEEKMEICLPGEFALKDLMKINAEGT